MPVMQCLLLKAYRNGEVCIYVTISYYNHKLLKHIFCLKMCMFHIAIKPNYFHYIQKNNLHVSNYVSAWRINSTNVIVLQIIKARSHVSQCFWTLICIGASVMFSIQMVAVFQSK